MSKKEKDFKFWCQVDIVKGGDKDAPSFKLGGIASTRDEDADGESLDPDGFDIEDFKRIGIVNWHHQAKNRPATVIGEPTKAEIRDEGFYVETELYKSSTIAQEVFELAQTLNTDSKTRRLGYSIEGEVIERESDDENDPGFNRIKKAKITGLAITHMPKNHKTFADIIKGYIGKEDEEEEDEKEETVKTEESSEEKALDTSSGAALTKESVDGYKVKEFKKGEMFKTIFNTFPAITFEKAEQVYEFFNKINEKMKKEDIKTDDLKKAMDHLGIGDLDKNPFLEKGGSKKTTKKGEDSSEKTEGKKGDDSDEEDEEDKIASKVDKNQYKGDGSGKKRGTEVKKGADSNKIGDKPKTSGRGSSEILKALGSYNEDQTKNVRALAKLVKAQLDETDLLKEKLEKSEQSQLETQKELSKAIDLIKGLSTQSQGKKSVTSYRDKEFDNGIEKAKQNTNVLSVSKNKKEVINVLDRATVAKGGYDEEFAKATMSLEAGSALSTNVIERAKHELGIQIVQ